MKRSLCLLSLLLPCSIVLAATPSPDERDSRVFRLNAMLDPAVEHHDVGVNFEVATGVAIAPFSEVAIQLGHTDTGAADRTEVTLYAEDTFDVGLPFLPYASAGIGYAWTRQPDGKSLDSLFGEIEGGVKFRLTPNHAVGLGVEYSYSLEDIYPKRSNKPDDHNLEVGLSFSYYY